MSCNFVSDKSSPIGSKTAFSFQSTVGQHSSQKKILPVAIMAHNEERVIRRGIESILSQDVPEGFSVRVVVVANGCSDRTEEIVKDIEREKPGTIELIPMSEKGKTRAINRAIEFLDQISKTGISIPYVVFLDADCAFMGREALIGFVNRFEQQPLLCAVAAECLPDVFFSGRKGFVARMYRALYRFSETLERNSISGMSYGIRLDVLREVGFPDFQFAEDMYLSHRLSGYFLLDRNIRIVFKTPSGLIAEIRRRTRQAISTMRYHEYYSFLSAKGVRVKLFDGALGSGYVWGGTSRGDMIRMWIRLKGIGSRSFVLSYFLIKLWAKFLAHMKLKRSRGSADFDYWKVVR